VVVVRILTSMCSRMAIERAKRRTQERSCVALPVRDMVGACVWGGEMKGGGRDENGAYVPPFATSTAAPAEWYTTRG